MKTLASLLIFTTGLAVAAEKSGFDKATLEAYLRHVELWIPDVGVKIDDAKESKTLPGFLDVTVHLTFNKNDLPDQHYYMSKDGKKIFRADVYDINKNPFQANVDKLDLKGAPTLGPANAPITVVVFSDFECPMCKQESEVIHHEIETAFPTEVRVYFRDFPLPQHTWAKQAAIAGRCVLKQSPEAFWQYHDWTFDNQGYIGLDNINSKLQDFVKDKGLDGMQFSRCVESKATEPEVNASLAIGQSLSINSTPTIFVNGRKLEGAVPWDTLRPLIEMELDHQSHDVSLTTSAGGASTDESCCTVSLPTVTATGAPSISSEIARIERGPHSALPPAVGTPLPGGEQSGPIPRTVENRTAYTLTVFFAGPAEQKITLTPGSTEVVQLPPGTYKVAARVTAPNVHPFFGIQTYSPGRGYSSHFYIQ